ncbi:MAG: hypothetical protein JW818_00705 [Pirellulales bacterium]|nr:hypothetical protein [Pirellulales bacterium]
MLTLIAIATSGSVSADKEKQNILVPELDGRPVFLTFGMAVVHPKGVESPPKSYEGVMRGTTPLAIMKIDGKVVGEVYGSPLKGKAKDEADDMRGSADKSPLVTLLKRDSAERAKHAHQITTLRIDVPSKLGKPWIIHSLYFQRGDHSVTFKFVAGEKDFKRVLPLFDAMLFTQEFIKRPVTKPEPETGTKGAEQGGSAKGD